jgi:hypothetical protein
MHGYEISINKKSIFLTCFEGGGWDSSTFTSSQFSIRNERLRLIGYNYTYIENSKDKFNPDNTRSEEESVNYMTGIKIKTIKFKGKTLKKEKTKLAAASL